MQEEDTGKILYTDRLVQSPDQMQLDDIHGICETRNQSLEVDWTTKQVHFKQHYFYNYENSMYVEIDLHKKDTQLKGQFKVEGFYYRATVVGKYLHYNKSNKKVIANVNKPEVEGTIIFEKIPNGIKIKEIKLMEKGINFNTYFTQEIIMKRQG